MREDLTGQKFGHLTVKYFNSNYITKNGNIVGRWMCECDCGNPNLVATTKNHLKTGHTQSCGCLHKEVMTKICKDRRQENKYDLKSEDYGIGYASNTDKHDKNYFYFDLEDYNKIKNYCWFFDSNGYLTAYLNNTTIKLHRLIMNLDNDNNNEVDHIHGEKTRNDNRKSNLRIATKQQNLMNKKIYKNNTSGYTGVRLNKNNRWDASITINKNTIYLGSFNTKEDAVKARKEAEEKYFGEWSYDNSQKHGINEN